MSYSTVADIVNKLGEGDLAQLSNENDPNVTNDTLIQDAILKADNMINVYLRGRYSLPIEWDDSETGTDILNTISSAMATYYLFSRASGVPEQIGNDYKDAMQELKNLQKGLTILNVKTGIITRGVTKTNKVSDDRLFFT
ncbi:DUF1320 domain-containing protein [Patescibacteria group bacterium]|nr:DUF1320 domain-containing protein [Patescibacteria group bacterium]